MFLVFGFTTEECCFFFRCYIQGNSERNFNFLSKNGFKVKYCRGNLNALKNAVATGNPVIAMIKIRPDKNWLHYIPVVGYDGQNIFVAESLAELSNCNEPHYNRRIPAKEFKKLWNTAMPKMPLYANTFFTVER